MTARTRWGGTLVAALAWLLALGGADQVSPGEGNKPPAIERDTAPCVRTGTRPKVCAFVIDDKAVARVSVVFRAGGTKPYYWTLMMFDGARYCGWLPQPSSGTTSIEYYVEAFDDEYEISRSRSATLPVSPDCRALEGQPPAVLSPVVGAAPGQPATPPGFEVGTARPTP